MIEKIKEQSLREFLTETDLPIVLYGMGNGADMIIEMLNSFGIEFRDIFAGDKFVRGHSFHGIRVKKYSEIRELYGRCVILMTFAVHDEETFDFIKKIAEENVFLSPTVPVIPGTELFTPDFIREHEEEFDKAFEQLADEKSRSTFVDVLNYKVSGKIEYLFRCQQDKPVLYDTIFPLNKDESILDLGAYDGDTIREFLQVTGGEYEKIFAFEPDPKNFRKLCNKTEQLENIEMFNIAAWNKEEILYFDKKSGRNSRKSDEGTPIAFNAPDNLIKEKVTFIKMDIEGAESEAIDGCRELILKYHPKLYICAYHRNEDVFNLITKVLSIRNDYKVFYRHHPYIPAWESNLYFVPTDN